MLPILPILILLTCVELIWGISTDANQGLTNVTIPNRVAAAPSATPTIFEFERCILNKYHIHYIAPHTEDARNGSKLPPATECGPPQGSPHINFHFDLCKEGKTPPCNDCNFPFTKYSQWTKLRNEYLTFVHNWHGFIYSRGTRRCVCLWDSQPPKDKFDICIDTDVRSAVMAVVKAVQAIAQAIWEKITSEPLQVRIAIMAIVVAALVLFLPALLEALAAAGVAVSGALIAEAVALFTAGVNAAFSL